MGSRPFLTVGRGKSTEQAFWREVLAAVQTHGNSGYTGTIAEKYEFVEFGPSAEASSFDLARWTLDFDDPDRDERLADMPPELEPLVARLAGIALDKWGPAMALELTREECADHVPLTGYRLYLFFGWAPY